MLVDRARAVGRLAAGLVVGGVLALGTAMPANASATATAAVPARTGTSTGTGAAAGTSTPAKSGAPDYRSACSAGTTKAGFAHCDAMVRTDVPRTTQQALTVHPDIPPSGYGPSSLQSAYNLYSASQIGGGGQTVAVVDAYNDPNANADLSVYRAEYGLPACTVASGCFKIVSETGSTTALPPNAPASDDWTAEESLDVDMVSAVCPNCHIVLVEATSPSIADLGTAMNQAVTQGAKFVSNSYGASESAAETGWDSSYYDHPGIAVTASAGDSGYGVEYPAASPYVTSVGGTSLTTASNARGWTESVWSTSSTEGTGSGCSAYEPKPTWQTDTGCSHRTVADVSAVADPDTGVAVYDTFNSEGGWAVYGGTSVASPIIASVYALAGTPIASSNPASYPYRHTANLYDVTSGSTDTCSPAYLCTGEVGYDGPTGNGTPNGISAFSGSNFSPTPEIAFQSNAGVLWTATATSGTNLGLNVMAGTSPSIAALSTGGFEVAYQSTTGHLSLYGTAETYNSTLGMMPGTSPSIAASPNGGFEIAFQASSAGVLWTFNGTVNTDLGYAMEADTSPSIAALTTGGYEIAYQTSTGHLSIYGSAVTLASTLGMMTDTSPSIAASSNGWFNVAFQANTGVLWTYDGSGGGSLGLNMAAGTNPSICAPAAGGYEIAYQTSAGVLAIYGSAATLTSTLDMMAGESPSIAALPGGWFQSAFQANTGVLWTYQGSGYADLSLGVAYNTSPSIAG
jgi:subtilase family serine protease